MKTKIKVVAIYVRVSTLEQAKEGYSIPIQIERLQKFAEAHGWIVFKIYVDAGRSGANTDREALQEMLADIADGRIDAVLVYKLDRLSRSQRDVLELIDTFMEKSVEFVSMSESLDTSTPYGRAMIGILAAFAQLERDMIQERMESGRIGRFEDGLWKGGNNVPLGYRYVDGMLEIENFEATAIREAFRMCTQRIPINSIAKRLNAAGMARTNQPWIKQTLDYILSNKIYIGYVKRGDEYNKGKHDPIIDEETFEKVQQILDERKNSEIYKNSFSYTSYLGGFIWCGNCGARYFKRNRPKPRKDGTFRHTYSCYSRAKNGKSRIVDPNCKAPHIAEHDLDEFIFEQIRKLKTDPEYANTLKVTSIDNESEEKIKILEERIKDIDVQRSRLTDLYTIGSINIDEVRTKADGLLADRRKLLLAIEDLKSEPDMTSDEAIKIAEGFDEILENGTFEDVRAAIAELIDHIVIKDKDNIEIHWNFV